MKRISVITFLILIGFIYTKGQETEKKQYKTVKISIAPDIDGILNDDAWLAGEWADDFTQYEPFNGKPASQRTEFKILYDDDNLYVAIKAYDTCPDSIVSRLSRRDNTDGDLVGIILDSYHDLRTGFLFGVSSSGVKYDRIFTNDGNNDDPSWDPNWWVKTSVNGQGWVAEMKIPFSQLRFEKSSGNVWGLEVARQLFRKNEMSFWQHIPKDAPGLIHNFGELVGLDHIRSRKILDITPYGVGKLETFKSEPENPFLEKGKLSKINGGIDAKIGLTNNITMDLTINPDFGQVEADPSEVNLSAYETFFSEKRPFFIEGNNITDFNLGIGNGDVGNDNLFYSRRIGRQPQVHPELEDGMYARTPVSTTILGAAKITGKTKDGISLGFIEAVTGGEMAEIDLKGKRSFKTVEPLTNYLVGRMQKDFNEGKTILGGIFTGTNRDLDADLVNILHKSAYTGGIDFTQYIKDKKWMFNINSAFSRVGGSKEAIEKTQRSSARYFQRPDNNTVLDPNRTSLSGTGGRIQLMKLNGHLNLMGVVSWKTPGFETNDIGYLREADQILAVFWAGYNQWEPKWIYRSYNLNMDVYTISNFAGDRIMNGIEFNGSTTLKNYWNAWGGGNLNSNSLSTGILRGGPSMKTPGTINLYAGFSTDYRKKLKLEFIFNTSMGFNDCSSNIYSGIGLSFKPVNYLTLSLDPGFSKSYTELQYVSHEDYYGSDRYVFASIDRKTISSSFKINFNLSPDLTVQYWGQPFIASGKFYDYKYITDPKADRYRDRFKTYINDQITPDNDYLNIDENLDGIIDYGFDRGDFIVREFLSNLVLRWEYNPGSSVYLVWSQARNSSGRTGRMDYLDDLSNLFDRDDNIPHNIFLVKFSYRFGIN